MSDAIACAAPTPASKPVLVYCYSTRDAALELLRSPRRRQQLLDACWEEGPLQAYSALIREANAALPPVYEGVVAEMITRAQSLKPANRRRDLRQGRRIR
jgi:hypothetical protein